MSEEKIICTSCEEEIEEDDNTTTYTTLKGEEVCEGCHESAWQYPSTCIHFSPDGEEHEAEHFTADFGNLEGEMPTPVASQEWKQSDGWRGYTTWTLKPGYVVLADGWTTGYPDDSVPRKQKIADLFEEFSAGNITPPVDLWWLFGITSNVFSQVTDIVCRERDVVALEEWLKEEAGVSKEDLEYMLT